MDLLFKLLSASYVCWFLYESFSLLKPSGNNPEMSLTLLKLQTTPKQPVPRLLMRDSIERVSHSPSIQWTVSLSFEPVKCTDVAFLKADYCWITWHSGFLPPTVHFSKVPHCCLLWCLWRQKFVSFLLCCVVDLYYKTLLVIWWTTVDQSRMCFFLFSR